VTNAWLALAPFAVAVATAIVLAVRATPATLFADYRQAVPAVIAWACVSALAPALAQYEISPLNRGNASVLWLVAAGTLLSLVTLTILRVREGRTQPKSQARPARERGLAPGLALDDSTS
jgi:heme exporter protein D